MNGRQSWQGRPAETARAPMGSRDAAEAAFTSATTAPPEAPPPKPPTIPGVTELVSLRIRRDVLAHFQETTQRMTVSVDGETRYSWPVSTGMRGYATPVGSCKPFRLEGRHYSKEWDDVPMSHSIFFTPAGHAIHGSNATRRLGSPASHGCIRVFTGERRQAICAHQRRGTE
jgi:lipoprotein-anchoring transpeptidase ErfK/SrfK